MSNIKERYLIAPQMELYDQVTCDYRPFVMFFNSANFSSKSINTDNLGFRLNSWGDELKKSECFFNSSPQLFNLNPKLSVLMDFDEKFALLKNITNGW